MLITCESDIQINNKEIIDTFARLSSVLSKHLI